MVGPMGGDAGSPRASTTIVRDVDSGPLEGDVESLGAPTTIVGDIDGGLP
jgi:hypothetical protein